MQCTEIRYKHMYITCLVSLLYQAYAWYRQYSSVNFSSCVIYDLQLQVIESQLQLARDERILVSHILSLQEGQQSHTPWECLQTGTQVPPGPSLPLISGVSSWLTSFCVATFFLTAGRRALGVPRSPHQKGTAYCDPCSQGQPGSGSTRPAAGVQRTASEQKGSTQVNHRLREAAKPIWQGQGNDRCCCLRVYPFQLPV